MQQTIFSILTNKETRNSRVVEKALDQEFTAGVPWFSKSQTDLPPIKIDATS
jgi:hypothetical protein